MQKTSATNGTGSLPRENLRFRRQILIEAQQLVQIIDETEDLIERFHTQDTPAFTEWYAGQLRPEKQHIVDLERELAAAVQFHNSMVALTKLKAMTLPQAFRAMKEEQACYLTGNEARRRRIEEERLARDRFVREDLDKEFQERVTPLTTPPNAPVIGDEERLKLVYRRLVRRLHPDMQGPNMDVTEARWQKRIWHLSQQARQRADVQELDALYKVSLLRQMELSELTISDAHEVHAWLKREMSGLESELGEHRLHPAWEFSLHGPSEALLERLTRELTQERQFLQSELDEVKGQHAYLEVMSYSESAPDFTPELKRRRSRPKSTQQDERQLSFRLD